MRIMNAEDFGLGFNCMTRLYMKQYEEKYLDAITDVLNTHIKYFSYRTIVCSLRDFVEGPSFNGGLNIPKIHEERVEYIIKRLVKQGLTLDKLKSQVHDEDLRIFKFGQEIYFCNYWNGNSRFDKASFVHWVYVNNLTESVEYKIVNWSNNISIPLRKSKIETLNSVCIAMLEYSYGRHTYMPSTCVNFIKANMSNLSDYILEELNTYLSTNNKKMVIAESAIENIDDKTWRIFEEDISLELISRDSYRNISDIEVCKKQLLELNNLQRITTQKECREIIAYLDGVKRYIDSLVSDEKIDLSEKYQLVKNVLLNHLHDLWKKEEGHLYKEISDGVYVRI